jgi:carboxyl-terminal processing protease
MRSKDLQLYKKALSGVFIQIKKTFPFSSVFQFHQLKQKYHKAYTSLEYIPNDEAFFQLVKSFISELKNSHTKLGSYPVQKNYYGPRGYRIVFVDDCFYLIKGQKNVLGRIHSIDGELIAPLFAKYRKRLKNYSEQYSRHLILSHNFLVAEERKPVILSVYNKGKLKKLKINRFKLESAPSREDISTKTLSNDIGYIKIGKWIDSDENRTRIDNFIKLSTSGKISSLIVDVRNNTGGDSRIADRLAEHFFPGKSKVSFGYVFVRKNVSGFYLRKKGLTRIPVPPHFSGPIIILANNACMSSCEYFISALADNKRALIVGERTAGGSGNPNKIRIPFRNTYFEIFISTWIYYRPNNKTLEGKGIEPHISIHPKLKDVAAGDDAVLKKAISFLS